jgi:hypothetical protein
MRQVEGQWEDISRQAAVLSASEARLQRQLADMSARKKEAEEDARTTQTLRLQDEQVCVCVCGGGGDDYDDDVGHEQAAAANIQVLKAQLEKRQHQLLDVSKREQVMIFIFVCYGKPQY